MAVIMERMRSDDLPHVRVVIPWSAPAEQCNRLMVELEYTRFVEGVEFADVEHVEVVKLDERSWLTWPDCAWCGASNVVLPGRPEHVCPPRTTELRGILGFDGIRAVDDGR